MGDTISVTCPDCDKAMNVPAAAEGKKIRCKGCGATFPVKSSKPSGKAPAGKDKAKAQLPAKAAGKAPASYKKVADDDDENPNPYTITKTELGNRCPHCAKEMEEGDIICLNCGYNTQTRVRIDVQRTYVNTPGQQFLWLLPGILCIVGILALIGFDIWFLFGLRDTWKSWDEDMPKSFSGGVRTFVTIGCVFTMYLLGRFAVKRLIFNPVRPESVRYR